MATSQATVLCGVCETRHLTKAADHWCPECEEGLCSDCMDHHSASKGTRKHKVIVIENYKNLPVFVADITDNCKKHELKFTNYCTQHDSMCCPACLSTDHQKCTEIRLLTDFVDNAKCSALISLIVDKIKSLQCFLNKGIQLKKENLTTFTQDRENIVRQIKEFRQKINSYLDKLENNLMATLTETVDTTNKKIQQCTTELTDSLICITELEKSMNALKEFGSDLQTFFGTRKINEKLDEETEKLEIMHKEGFLNLSNLNVKLNDELANTISKLTTFGTVSIHIIPSSLQFPKTDNKEAQIMSVPRTTTPKSVEDIQLSLQRIIEIPTGSRDPYITGCAICPNGNIMFTDYNNDRLIISDQDGTLQSQITVTGGPTDVTVIDDNTAAVSTLNGIKIIDVISKQTKQSIDTKKECFGMTYHKGSLLWCEKSVGVQSKQLPGGDICTLIHQKDLPYWSYLTTFEDHIFVANPDTSAITCYTTQGDILWEYRDQSTLRRPQGITADSDSNLYITSETVGVFVMSADGKRVRLLLSTDDKLTDPTGIYFDKSRNNLLIANREGPAYVYHMSYDPLGHSLILYGSPTTHIL